MMKMKKHYYSPRYWGLWLLFGVLRLLVLLPYRWQMRFGAMLGYIGFYVAKQRKHITLTNLRIAFPQKTPLQHQQLCKRCFASAGMSAMETLIAWFMSDKRFAKIDIKFHNDECINEAIAKGDRPILLLGTHFLCMEIIGRYSGQHYSSPFYLIYQKHRNPLFESIMTSSRSRYVTGCLQRKNMFAIIKALKRNSIVWYAPDQDFGHEHTIFAPFFGKLCATLTATTWLAKQTNAHVIPCYYVRRADLSGYDAYAVPTLLNFPSGDEYQDAQVYNAFLEDAIRAHPEQYLWLHRRYKTRPAGEDKLY